MNRSKITRTRRWRKTRRIAVIVSTLSVLQLATPGRANAQTGTPVDWFIDPIGDLVGGGISGVASTVANTIFEKVLEFVAGLIADAVTKATELLISVFDAIDVQVGADGTLTGAASSKLHLQMVAFGGFLVTLLFLVRLASALIHRQMGQVARELFFDLPITIIGTAAAGAIGYIFLQVTNEMAATFSQDFATNIGAFAGQFFTKDALVSGGIFSILFAIVYIIGAVLVGLELIIRASLLTVIFAVAPVMIATRTWEGTRRYSRKFIEVSFALLFAKPAAAFALALGSAQLADPGDGTDIVKLLLGTTITIMAAYMPFALFKLIPIVEGAAVQQGIKGAPVRVAQTALGMAASAALIAGSGGAAAGAAGATGGAGGAGGGAGGAGGGGGPSGAAGSGGRTPSPGGGPDPAPSPASGPSRPVGSPQPSGPSNENTEDGPADDPGVSPSPSDASNQPAPASTRSTGARPSRTTVSPTSSDGAVGNASQGPGDGDLSEAPLGEVTTSSPSGGANSSRPPLSAGTARGSRGAALNVANRAVGSVPTQQQQVVSVDSFFDDDNSDDEEGARV
jgi:hypothetical protein